MTYEELLERINELEKENISLKNQLREQANERVTSNDDFLYEYALLQDENAKANMEINHGEQTIKDIDDIRKKNPKLLGELTEWLGSKPLQVKHKGRDGKVYCLAHAFFDEVLYNQNNYQSFLRIFY